MSRPPPKPRGVLPSSSGQSRTPPVSPRHPAVAASDRRGLRANASPISPHYPHQHVASGQSSSASSPRPSLNQKPSYGSKSTASTFYLARASDATIGSVYTSASTAATSVSPATDRGEAIFSPLGLSWSRQTFGGFSEKELMDLRYTVCQFVRPVEPTRSQRLPKMNKAQIKFMAIMASDQPDPKRCREALQAQLEASPFYSSASGTSSTESQNSVASFRYTPAKTNLEEDQSKMINVILSCISHKAALAETSTLESAKYQRLADRVLRTYRSDDSFSPEFLSTWSYRLSLLVKLEKLYWEHGCNPIPALVKGDVVLPHHLLCMVMAQLALWPQSVTPLAKSKVPFHVAQYTFAHLQNHRSRFDWTIEFEQKMDFLKGAWMTPRTGSGGTGESPLPTPVMVSILRHADECEYKAGMAWLPIPRSELSKTNKLLNKPLPPLRSDFSRSKKPTGIPAGRANGTAAKTNNPFLPGVDLEARRRHIKKMMRGERSSSVLPQLPPQPILSSFSMKDNPNQNSEPPHSAPPHPTPYQAAAAAAAAAAGAVSAAPSGKKEKRHTVAVPVKKRGFFSSLFAKSRLGTVSKPKGEKSAAERMKISYPVSARAQPQPQPQQHLQPEGPPPPARSVSDSGMRHKARAGTATAAAGPGGNAESGAASGQRRLGPKTAQDRPRLRPVASRPRLGAGGKPLYPPPEAAFVPRRAVPRPSTVRAGTPSRGRLTSARPFRTVRGGGSGAVGQKPALKKRSFWTSKLFGN